MTDGVLRPPYKVLEPGKKLGCVHHFIIDNFNVGRCKKIGCGEVRQFPTSSGHYWDEKRKAAAEGRRKGGRPHKAVAT